MRLGGVSVSLSALLLCFCLIGSVVAQQSPPPTVAMYVSRRLGYLAQNAAFGAQVTEYLNINAMYPPKDEPNLCLYPKSLKNLTSNTQLNSTSAPIAFVIGESTVPGCTPEHQAMVALKIQKSVTSSLQYLIIYGNNASDNNALQILYPDSATGGSTSGGNSNYTDDAFANPNPDFSTLTILYVNYLTGVDIQQQFAFRSEWWNVDPHFGNTKNLGWSFFFRVGPYDSNPNATSSSGPTDSFYWFRIVLFTLLIVSPCCRAGYLWYAAGGRLQFRRDENGRIIGIQYIPPSRHWLTSGMIPSRLEHVSNTLTEEKFNQLPEISYVPRPGDEADGEHHRDRANDLEGNQGNDYEDEQNHGAPEQSFVLEFGTDFEKESAGDAHPPDVEEGVVSNETDETRADPSTSPGATRATARAFGLRTSSRFSRSTVNAPSSTLTTNCTMCSICIDDFEAGERLILLPKCQHAFHRDCIHPWLTERQGCCPLCKTDVFDEQVENNASNSGGNPDAEESAATSAAAEEQGSTQGQATDEAATTSAGIGGTSSSLPSAAANDSIYLNDNEDDVVESTNTRRTERVRERNDRRSNI